MVGCFFKYHTCPTSNCITVLKMQGADGPSRAPISLVSFNTSEDIRNMAIGCDSDIGGTSSAHLDFVPDKNDPNGKGKGRFWGEMRLGVRGELQGKVRGGYAGFRSKVRKSFQTPFRVSFFLSSFLSFLGDTLECVENSRFFLVL